MRRYQPRAVMAVVILAFVFAGCKADATGPSINPVGSWSGTTSQSLPFTFQVTTAGLTQVTMSFLLNGSRCSYRADVSINPTAVPITNNAITVTGYQLGSGTTLSATGNFTSSTASSGTFQVSDTSCGGSTSGTWTATKH